MLAQNFSVLIADDNELNSWVLCEQLRQWTTDTVIAAEGHEAWRCLEARKFGLVFLDLHMPFMNGMDLIQKMRSPAALNQFTPAVAITALSQGDQRGALLAAGFSDCLFKPILLQHLKQLLEQWPAMFAEDPQTCYTAKIMKKTACSREIGEQLLNQLLMEVPKFLTGIVQAQRQRDYREAWDLAHKLHGAFCFYGFNDFLLMAESLAQSLLNQDDANAYTCLQAIQLQFEAISKNKPELLSKVVADFIRDA